MRDGHDMAESPGMMEANQRLKGDGKMCMEQNLREEQAADYQVYEAMGSHREIGRITARRGGCVVPPLEGALSAEQAKLARECRAIVQEIFPEIIEEFQGYAEELGLQEEDILWHYSLGMIGGCSSIAVRTPEGMLVGRNYDYFYIEKRRHLIRTVPQVGQAHVGIHEGLIGGRFDGLNEKGLFVSFHGAGPRPERIRPGMSFHLIVRYLLERCKSAAEARDVLMELPVLEPKNYLLADQREAFAVEAHPDRKRVRHLEGDVLVVTNHFVHPEMEPYQPVWPNSGRRYHSLWQQGQRLKVLHSDALGALQRALAEHEAPVCGHEDGLATFWSATANLTEGQVWYSLGAPCRNPYRVYFDGKVGELL
jgi:hypothetical protein